MTDSTPPPPTSTPTSEAPPLTSGGDDAAAGRLGLTGLLLSILGLLTCGLWLFSLPGLIVSIVATQKGKSAKATAGVIIGAAGVLEFLVAVPLMLGLLLPALSKARTVAAEVQTTSQLQSIHQSMTQSGRPVANPTDAGGSPGSTVSPETHPELPHHMDPWGNPYRIQAAPNGGGDHVVTSDGPDGEPGTEDDLRHPPE